MSNVGNGFIVHNTKGTKSSHRSSLPTRDEVKEGKVDVKSGETGTKRIQKGSQSWLHNRPRNWPERKKKKKLALPLPSLDFLSCSPATSPLHLSTTPPPLPIPIPIPSPSLHLL